MTDLYNEEKPHWASGRATGYMQVGAQLATRDGRKVGNAFVFSISTKDGKQFAEIRTDMGNILVCTEDELRELFHCPIWIMDPVFAHAPFIFKTHKGEHSVKEASVICVNDSIEAVTLAGDEAAEINMQRLKTMHQNHCGQKDYQDRYYWHIHKVNLM